MKQNPCLGPIAQCRAQTYASIKYLPSISEALSLIK